MYLLDAPLQRIVGRFVPASLPPTSTFDNQTVLLVGATSGIGLAAAVHFATLGARVIITYRSASRGDVAKQQIEEAVGPNRKGDVSCLELDLERYESCTNFMAALKTVLPDPAALDVVVMNGGMVNSHWEESAEGWEKTIQINTLGTTLVALLLLGWMRGARRDRSAPAHMSFLASRDHLDPDLDQLTTWSQSDDGILRQACSKENWPDHWYEWEPHYPLSKLLLMYNIEEMSRLVRGPDGDPLVIINSICPGMVKTEIGRHICERSWIHSLATYLVLLITAKTADSGSRICVTAALKPKESHGEFFSYWLTEDQWRSKAATLIGSDEAKKLQKVVWKETIDELEAHVPHLRNGLDAL
ncbi:hypothetical protein F4808DRAFT_265218 [Astrocystis sublimbata]|nr:hypothetical protein F4808DRAFT_265218 [Astrocystis sublimbata]